MAFSKLPVERGNPHKCVDVHSLINLTDRIATMDGRRTVITG